MEKERAGQIIRKLLEEMEEEDVGMSLLTTFSRERSELSFFNVRDEERVLQILEKLSDDSRRHKNILKQIVTCLERRYHGN